MTEPDRTWIVLQRDLTAAVVIGDVADVFMTLVLDAGTGLILATNIDETAHESLRGALNRGLTTQVSELDPRPPDLVVCEPELVAAMSHALAELVTDPPPVTEGISAEAEEVFDAVLGHLGGRAQPDEPPEPHDWARLFEVAADYASAEMWTRWSDADHLVCEVTLDGRAQTYLVVVMGNAGLQYGLVAYPGRALPEGIETWEPGEPMPIPEGSVMLWLDPMDESVPELVAKAHRYGWPDDADLHPACLTGSPDGPADLSRVDAQRLTVVISAAMAYDARRLRVAGKADVSTGEVTLGDGGAARYSIAPAP